RSRCSLVVLIFTPLWPDCTGLVCCGAALRRGQPVAHALAQPGHVLVVQLAQELIEHGANPLVNQCNQFGALVVRLAVLKQRSGGAILALVFLRCQLAELPVEALTAGAAVAPYRELRRAPVGDLATLVPASRHGL